ncbi:hypothetical protein KXX17_005604 [Aspergillus fumigatus]|nr:hypothetical protein KXX17_005604 [Aspergillus fumigatus]
MAFNSETTVNYGMSVSDKEAFGQSLAHGINLGRQTSCLDKGSASNGNKRLTGSPPKTINKRKLMAKIDWHVLPCFINIGNAAILGLKKVLHSQTGTEYNAALTFPPCLALPLESRRISW